MEHSDKVPKDSCFVGVEQGSLCVDFKGKSLELWFERDDRKYKLLPRDDEDFQQLSLPLAYDFNLVEIARSYKALFDKAVEVHCRFKEGRKEIVAFCLRYGSEALDLIEDCPGLALLVASESFYQYRSDHIFSPAQKRTQLLKLCGYPATNSTVKQFKKIPGSESCLVLFHGLKTILVSACQDIVNSIRHTKIINRHVVELLLVEELHPYVEYPLVEEVSLISYGDFRINSLYALRDIRDVLSNAIDDGLKIRPLRKMADIDVLHDDLTDWLSGSSSYFHIKHLKFTMPPLQALEVRAGKIIPITTGIELWNEGQSMHHCVAGLAETIVKADGSRYIYHLEIQDGEEATLFILKDGVNWQIEEIKGPCNSEVSEKMMNFVLSWLSSC